MQLPDSCAQPTLLVPSEAHPTLGSALAALAASSASATTIRLAAGVYREEGPLHLCRGVSLVGAGRDTVLESEGTVLVCDGAALVSDAVWNPFHAPNWKQSGELANDVYRKHSWARCAVFS